MKNYGKFHRLTVLLGLTFVLIVGLCFPSPILQTASADDGDGDADHSGGFKVNVEKVEGAINAAEILQGTLDIPEGNLYGLTITKVLEKTPEGLPNLLIQIKSQGPNHFTGLKGKLIGFPNIGLDPCTPSQEVGSNGEPWICLTESKMTLSEQSVASIELKSATVETCFEGEEGSGLCEGEEPETESEMSVKMANLDKSLEDIQEDITNLEQLMEKIDELMKNAKEMHETIKDEEQVVNLRDLLEGAKEVMDQPDQLLGLIRPEEDTEEKDAEDKVSDRYGQFNEHVSQLVLTVANADDLLKLMSNVIKEDKERLTELAEERDKAAEKSENPQAVNVQQLQKQTDKSGSTESNKKQNNKSKQTDKKKSNDQVKQAAGETKKEENKKLNHDKDKDKDQNTDSELTIENLEEDLSNIRDEAKEKRGEVDKVKDQGQELNEQLDGFYKDIGKLSDDVKESKAEYGYTDDQLAAVLEVLDVAEPGKMIGKHIVDLQEQLEEIDGLDAVKQQAEDLGQLLEEAEEAVSESVLPVKLADNIKKQNEQLSEDMKTVSEQADEMKKKRSKQIEAVEEDLNEFVSQVNMPERLADKYKMKRLPGEEINDYRASMKENIDEWQKQLAQIKKDLNLDALKEQQKNIHKVMNDLRKAVQKSKDRYSEEALQFIMESLQTPDSTDHREEDISGDQRDKHKDGNDDPDELKQQLIETIRKGRQQAKAIRPILEKAMSEMQEMKRLSDDLSDEFWFIDLIKTGNVDQLGEHLDHLLDYVKQMEIPAVEIEDALSAIKASGKQNDQMNADLKQLKETMDRFEEMTTDLEKVKAGLKDEDTPFFSKKPEYVSTIEEILAKIG